MNTFAYIGSIRDNTRSRGLGDVYKRQVIRRENWTVLQKQGAISNEDVRECKQRMNTFAYIGSIRDKPIVKCVYQTDVNENKFIIKGDGQAEDGGVGINKEAIQF